MNKAIPIRRAEHQPPVLDLNMAHGVFVKTIPLAEEGLLVPQHSHAYPHITVLMRGSIRVWCDDALKGDYHAPAGILIEAGTEHTFLTLTADTVLLCVHDIGKSGAVEIAAEHQFEGIG